MPYKSFNFVMAPLRAREKINLSDYIRNERPWLPELKIVNINWVREGASVLSMSGHKGECATYTGEGFSLKQDGLILQVHDGKSTRPMQFGVTVYSDDFLTQNLEFVPSDHVEALKIFNRTELSPSDLDDGMYPFIMACNDIPGLATRWSCAGHAKTTQSHNGRGSLIKVSPTYVMFYGSDHCGILPKFFSAIFRQKAKLRIKEPSLSCEPRMVIADHPVGNIIADFEALTYILRFRRHRSNLNVKDPFDGLVDLLQEVLRDSDY